MKRRLVAILTGFVLIAVVVSCSTEKNTPLTRRVQAFKARYNTYFNGHQAFLEGVEAQQNGNKDNYTEILPFYITGNKATRGLGKSSYERAAEKSKKTIKQHSITKRPEWKSSKPKTPKDKLWLSQKEYNPFLHKAWFLLGESQLRAGEYLEAASTFAYIQRLYFSKPNLVARARVMEARCYAELEWYYDAEDLLRRTARDSFPTSLVPLRAAVEADLQIRQEQYAEAIPNVQKAVRRAGGSVQKARLHFLLGQLYAKTGQTQQAYRSFKRVPRYNPPYELEFNARIQMTEVMSKGQSKQMIRRLQSMARNPKNADYLDQVYYAIGNIYLAKGDTTHAVYAYRDGVEKSTRNGIEKGVVWLHLGQLYWQQEKFVKAQECYAGVLSLFDKERDDYAAIDDRARILEELLPHAKAVELQDSLQALAQMDSVQRLKVIDRIIDEVKRKEKEEARKAAESSAPTRPGTNINNRPGAAAAAAANNRNQQSSVWYFYNPTAVAAGKQEFQQKWGQRKLEDHWRRLNKTVLADEVETPEDSVASDSLAQTADSLQQEGAVELTEKQKEELEKLKEREQDPHRREYYLKDIPLTDEQMEASNAALVDGLFNSAVIYKDRMENFPLAERTFQRLFTDFPDYKQTDEALYNMFQLYARQGRREEANVYKDRLLTEYPQNEHGKLIADPDFEFKGRFGRQIEDSLYVEAYEAFTRGDYATTVRHAAYTEREYPEGANRPRFMFLQTMSRLEMGDRQQFLEGMKTIVEKYPQSTVSELAGLYVKGLKDGRVLASGKYEMGSIWDRRTGVILDEGETPADTVFKADRSVPFLFAIAYERDSIDENQLLFEVARYNFTSFAVRNFDIVVQVGDGINMMQVKTFRDYDEAYVYMHRLYNNPEMDHKLQGLKAFIISEDNLRLLQHGRSFADYFDFYDRHFDRVGHLRVNDDSLDEPEPLTDEELEEMQMEEEDDEDWEEEENFIF